MKRASIRLAAATAFAASLASIPALAGNVSLTIQGVTGSFEVLAFDFGAKNAAETTTGGGSGAGKVSFGAFTFTSTESASSPSLFDYITTGRHSPSARLSVSNPDNGKPQSEWVLSDVLVTSFGTQNGALDPKAKLPNTFALPVTTFGLAFRRACYRVFAFDGSVAKEACWDISTNSGV